MWYILVNVRSLKLVTKLLLFRVLMCKWNSLAAVLSSGISFMNANDEKGTDIN